MTSVWELQIIPTPHILAFTFFKRSTAFTGNSIKIILVVERQERVMGAEYTIFIEFYKSLLVQTSSCCYADIFYYLQIQTAKESEQFENSVIATAGN